MLDHARKAVGYAAGRDRSDLDTDELLALSLVRLLEIVGEAAARVSSETRQRHDSLPWTDIVAMRNRLIHGYDTVDLDILWRTLRDDLPPLVRYLEAALAEE